MVEIHKPRINSSRPVSANSGRSPTGVAHGSRDPRRSIIRIRLGLESCCLWLRLGFGVKSAAGLG